MKEKIYTIPVLDGWQEKERCPFCAMILKLEKDAVDFILGSSYMEPDVRAQTDKLGFCSKHLNQMYAQGNRLGLALMLYTHLQAVNDALDAVKSARSADHLAAFLSRTRDNCFLCDKIQDTFYRYVDTFFYMWKNMPDIRNEFDGGHGLCLAHFTLLLETAPKKLRSAELLHFIGRLMQLQKNHFTNLETDLERFIKKFDYRFRDEPINGGKDALPRAMRTLEDF